MGAMAESCVTLIAAPHVEAVWIATPNRLHAAQTITAAQAGKHVVVQKPMALKLDEALAMVDAVETNGVHMIAGNSPRAPYAG